jgi:hypothetical protein
MSVFERNTLILPCPVGQVSDKYHTFDELYHHRQTLFVQLMNSHRLCHREPGTGEAIPTSSAAESKPGLFPTPVLK